MGLESLGISKNFLPQYPKKSGPLLVIASGWNTWEDLEQVWPWGGAVMCVNDMIMHYPGKVDHAYSNDHHWLGRWVDARRPRYVKDWGLPDQHTCQVGLSNQTVWPWPGHGTSSLNAVYTGLGMGYDDILIAGVPLDNGGHYFDPPWVKTNFQKEVPEKDGQPKYWQNAARDVFDGKVRSLSGRTRQFLDSLAR